MKICFVFLLVLLVLPPRLGGQQTIEEFQHLVLRLTFLPLYNNYPKSCCKLYPGGCYKLLDSQGYTCDLLRGRVSIAVSNGWTDFMISNVQLQDGGYYRCLVLYTDNRIYTDYFVEVSEVPAHRTQSVVSLTTTSRVPTRTSASLPQSTGAVVAEDHSEARRAPWSFSLPLAVVVSISVMIFITSVVGLIFCRLKVTQPAKHEEALCESLTTDVSENGSVVYTTVDFKAPRRPAERSARTQKAAKGAADSARGAEHDGTVEYSILAVHQ